MNKVLICVAVFIMFMALKPAHAQRCPAGQDQFMNCLSMNPQMRARQEQWANQPAARQIPGAQPYGAGGNRQQPTANSRCALAWIKRNWDGPLLQRTRTVKGYDPADAARKADAAYPEDWAEIRRRIAASCRGAGR
jgi:hypothetical protein